MNELPVLLIIVGITLLIAGILWYGSSKYLHLGKFPGDIALENDNFKLYFPLTSSVIISIILTLLLGIFLWLRK